MTPTPNPEAPEGGKVQSAAQVLQDLLSLFDRPGGMTDNLDEWEEAWERAREVEAGVPAAPAAINAELLAACEAAAEWLEGWASAEPYLSLLRAAIAAARGVRVIGHACKLDGSICESRPDRCSGCPAGAGGKS